MEKNVFMLYACNVPVKGNQRSCLCDLQRGRIKLIPNALHEILTKYEGKSLNWIKKKFKNQSNKEIDEYFNFLLDNDWGFLTKEYKCFPRLPLDWDYPSNITNAIIDVNNNSKHEYINIFYQLNELRCEYLELRFFCDLKMEKIDEILFLLEGSNIRSVEIFAKYSNYDNPDSGLENIKKYLLKHDRFDTLVFHSSPFDLIYKFNNKAISYTSEIVKDHSHCGKIDPRYFTINIPCFTESQNHNSCLNRKISIDIDGNIKNCPSMRNSYGNIKEVKLRKVIKNKNYTSSWDISKDKIDICKDCEFRFICTDCRAYIENERNIFSKPSKCRYNPYTMIWNNE